MSMKYRKQVSLESVNLKIDNVITITVNSTSAPSSARMHSNIPKRWVSQNFYRGVAMYPKGTHDR